MALQIKKMFPSASTLSRHEAWMLLLLLILARIFLVLDGQSKVLILPLPPNTT